jgi:large subunit ribosomal protein L4
MKAKIIDLENKEKGSVSLSENIFGVVPKESILNLVTKWQRAKKQAGTHHTKGRSDVSGTTRKPHKQKGTGKARLGSLRATQCRGGGISFGPTTRSHAFDLPKKVRKLGLKMALSAKFAEGKILFLEDIFVKQINTKSLNAKLSKICNKSLLVIHSDIVENNNFIKSSANILNVDVLPQIGANVYDLLKHEYLVITKDALSVLEERLK